MWLRSSCVGRAQWLIGYVYQDVGTRKNTHTHEKKTASVAVYTSTSPLIFLPGSKNCRQHPRLLSTTNLILALIFRPYSSVNGKSEELSWNHSSRLLSLSNRSFQSQIVFPHHILFPLQLTHVFFVFFLNAPFLKYLISGFWQVGWCCLTPKQTSSGGFMSRSFEAALLDGTGFAQPWAHPPELWLMLIRSFPYARERKQPELLSFDI